MHVSLLVATVNRIEPLDRLLDSLTLQAHKNFKVFIADQNPPGMLDGLLASYADKLDIRRLLISPSGVSAARNAIIHLADGDLVAFPDDDCFYAAETLANVVATFETYPHLGGILGHWSSPSCIVEQPAAFALPKPVSQFSVFWRGETFVQFYRRQTIATVGEFDELLGPGTGLPYGCGEDTDYLLRALNAGFVIGRTPSIHLYHDTVDFSSTTLSVKARVYGQGRSYLLKKHHFPLWFVACNIAYPLLRIPLDGPRAFHYRKEMFLGRLKGFLGNQ